MVSERVAESAPWKPCFNVEATICYLPWYFISKLMCCLGGERHFGLVHTLRIHFFWPPVIKNPCNLIHIEEHTQAVRRCSRQEVMLLRLSIFVREKVATTNIAHKRFHQAKRTSQKQQFSVYTQTLK